MAYIRQDQAKRPQRGFVRSAGVPAAMKPDSSKNAPADWPMRALPPPQSWKSSIKTALFVRRERWTLTWTGRLLILASVAALTMIPARGLYTFLAITDPVDGQFLIVEGWMSPYAYREAAAWFRKGHYQKAIAAGVLDWDEGGELREHFGGERLIGFGVPRDRVVTTSSDEVRQERTFHAAMAVKRWLHEQGLHAASIDLVTLGAHARRSRLVYQNALGNDVKVGVIALEDRRFEPDHWWQSSVGVRTVVGELIAYLYARVVYTEPQSRIVSD